MIENGWNVVFEDEGATCSVLMDDGKPELVSMTDTEETPCPWTSTEIEDQIATLYNVWCKVGEWSQGDGDQSVAGVTLREAQPTHRIVFTAPNGKVEWVDVVHLFDEVEDGIQPAYTLLEWRNETTASWSIEHGEWRCDGQVTPGGCSGTVEITAL